MSPGPGVLLGFDFGTRRIGAALGQRITGTARPLATITVRNGRPDWEAIGRLVAEWAPEALVVGLPLNMDDSEQEMTARARRFSRQLNGRYGLPVHLADERLTTREAARRLEETGRPVAALDPAAAAVILETWLNAEA